MFNDLDIREFYEKNRTKVAAVAGSVVFALLVVGVCMFAFRKKYNLKPLEALRAAQRPPTREELEQLAPLMSHPDPKVRIEVHGFFRQANPDDVKAVIEQQVGNADEAVASGLDDHYRRVDPAGAIRSMGSRLAGATEKDQADLYARIASTGLPEALPYIEEGLDKASDGVKERLAHEISIHPKLLSPKLVPKLQSLVRDKGLSEAIRRHAARALKSIAAGKPQQLQYDLPPGALDRM